MSLTIRLLNYLSGRSKVTVWLIIISSLAVIGLVDYVTGSQVAITFFYLLPVAVASWSLGKIPGRLVALLSAATMVGLDHFYGDWSRIPLLLWNLSARLGIFLVVANLIAEFQHHLKHQTELSSTDPLTGILNRRAFREAGALELERMRRHEHPLTLAFLDIDDFKSVNDDYGHAAGDALLTAVAGSLQAQLRGTDRVARLGGDEYGILLPETSLEAARKVLPRVLETARQEVARAQLQVTFSVGAVTCMAAPPGIDQLIHWADQLMYSVKRDGKNRIEHARYPDDSHLLERTYEELVSDPSLDA